MRKQIYLTLAFLIIAGIIIAIAFLNRTKVELLPEIREVAQNSYPNPCDTKDCNGK